MQYQSILEKLDTLKATRSKNKRNEILKQYLMELGPGADLLKVFQYGMDDDRTYNVGSVKPVDLQRTSVVPASADEVFNFLDYLNEKGSANNEDKAHINALGGTDPSLGILLDRIVKKDLKAGTSAKTINKLMGLDTIFDVPYQQCSRYEKAHNIQFPATIEEKADGCFVYGFEIANHRTNEPFLTRNGSGFNTFGVIEAQLNRFNDVWRDNIRTQFDSSKRIVTVGEMVLTDETGGTLLDRQTSNGLMDKFIDGTATEELARRIVYHLWTYIPQYDWYRQECDIPQNIRKTGLIDMLTMSEGTSQLHLIDGQEVANLEQAQAFYKRKRDQNKEGGVLKDHRDLWKYNRSGLSIKMKNVSEGEFKIVKAYYGNPGTSNEHRLGGITGISECGQVIADFGTGFKDKDRDRGVDWWNDRAGQVFTGKFTGISKDKTGRTTFSLENPRFTEDRFKDKTTANTYEELLAELD